MPAISALYGVFPRSVDGASSGSVSNVNGTGQSLDVVCAWPVSSQYGAGSRFLYALRVVLYLSQAHVSLQILCSCSHLRFSAESRVAKKCLSCSCVAGSVDWCTSWHRARVLPCEWSVLPTIPRHHTWYLAASNIHIPRRCRSRCFRGLAAVLDRHHRCANYPPYIWDLLQLGRPQSRLPVDNSADFRPDSAVH